MGRKRSPKRARAHEIYRANNGEVRLSDIARALDVQPTTVRTWKRIDKWSVGIGEADAADLHKDKRELNESEKMFCLSFAQSQNVMQAAVDAGYPVSDAKMIGYGMVREPHIWEEIEKLKEVRKKCFAGSEEDVLERQMRIAFADITDYVEFGAREAEVYDSKTKEKQVKIVNSVIFKDSRHIDGGVVAEVGVGADGSAKVKLADREKALDWLTRYFNMFPFDKRRGEYEKLEREAAERKRKGNERDIEIRFVSGDE